MHAKNKIHVIVACPFLNVCEKNHQFLSTIKKMHTKENSFFQPHGVYNSRAHQRGQTSANERYTSGVLSEMTRDVGGDASCQRQRQHQKPNEPHANHTRYVRLHSFTIQTITC